jgi:hypothetical protein
VSWLSMAGVLVSLRIGRCLSEGSRHRFGEAKARGVTQSPGPATPGSLGYLSSCWRAVDRPAGSPNQGHWSDRPAVSMRWRPGVRAQHLPMTPSLTASLTPSPEIPDISRGYDRSCGARFERPAFYRYIPKGLSGSRSFAPCSPIAASASRPFAATNSSWSRESFSARSVGAAHRSIRATSRSADATA